MMMNAEVAIPLRCKFEIATAAIFVNIQAEKFKPNGEETNW
jgi:hypothetical protein